MDAKQLLGINLRKQRKLNHLTQEQLSEKLGITTKHLGVIERGEAFCSADFLFNPDINLYSFLAAETLDFHLLILKILMFRRNSDITVIHFFTSLESFHKNRREREWGETGYGKRCGGWSEEG